MLAMLRQAEWNRVEAMVPPQARQILLDVVFHTTPKSIRITGKAHDLKNGDEAFSLAMFPHVAAGWWASGSHGQTEWPAIDLKSQWESQSLLQLVKGPRNILFYHDPLFEQRSTARDALLDNCSAIVFVNSGGDEGKCIVLRASNDSPCALDIGIGVEARQIMLEGFQEISVRALEKGDESG
ncbi:MAG TPA: hypothetical protein VGZ47_05145 [Gemmataceae bacterium]|nr:hypothetical protein [Gemmataceae bacterium]